MTSAAKLKLFLIIIVLAFAGVIAAVLTTNRDLLKPFPKEADVKVIFTSPQPFPTSNPAKPTEEKKPTNTPKPTKEESEDEEPTSAPTEEPDTTPTIEPTSSEASPSATTSP